jgi:hypothetical protein
MAVLAGVQCCGSACCVEQFLVPDGEGQPPGAAECASKDSRMLSGYGCDVS